MSSLKAQAYYYTLNNPFVNFFECSYQQKGSFILASVEFSPRKCTIEMNRKHTDCFFERSVPEKKNVSLDQ